jgi:hypothetical protein
MNRSLREALAIIAAAGLTIEAIVQGKRHTRIVCRDASSGHAGTLTVHGGSIHKSRFATGLRADARAIKRGHYLYGGVPT